jgi:hypothetical protein
MWKIFEQDNLILFFFFYSFYFLFSFLLTIFLCRFYISYSRAYIHLVHSNSSSTRIRIRSLSVCVSLNIDLCCLCVPFFSLQGACVCVCFNSPSFLSLVDIEDHRLYKQFSLSPFIYCYKTMYRYFTCSHFSSIISRQQKNQNVTLISFSFLVVLACVLARAHLFLA